MAKTFGDRLREMTERAREADEACTTKQYEMVIQGLKDYLDLPATRASMEEFAQLGLRAWAIDRTTDIARLLNKFCVDFEPFTHNGLTVKQNGMSFDRVIVKW
jgi:hypothetical protein